MLWAVLLTGLNLWFFAGSHGTGWVRLGMRLRSIARVGVVLLGVIFGMWGAWAARSGKQDWPERVSGALYVGVQHVVQNGNAADNDPVQLRMARLAGIGALVLLAYELVTRLFVDSSQRLRRDVGTATSSSAA